MIIDKWRRSYKREKVLFSIGDHYNDDAFMKVIIKFEAIIKQFMRISNTIARRNVLFH